MTIGFLYGAASVPHNPSSERHMVKHAARPMSVSTSHLFSKVLKAEADQSHMAAAGKKIPIQFSVRFLTKLASPLKIQKDRSTQNDQIICDCPSLRGLPKPWAAKRTAPAKCRPLHVRTH